MNDQELVQQTAAIIGELGAAFYFTPPTVAAGQRLGLDQYGFYALGRGGVLGDVEPAVVSAAFGYFNPALVAGLWNAAKAACSPRVAARAYAECAAEHGRATLSGVEGLEAFVAAADKVLAATDADTMTLFAGVAAEVTATDAPGRAMQQIVALREYRGGAHLAAVRVLNMSSKDAHFVKRPGDAAMFGWSPADGPVVDDELRARMAEAEVLTDRMVAPAFAVLDQGERDAFVAGVDAIAAAHGT